MANLGISEEFAPKAGGPGGQRVRRLAPSWLAGAAGSDGPGSPEKQRGSPQIDASLINAPEAAKDVGSCRYLAAANRLGGENGQKVGPALRHGNVSAEV